jgi:hypothetical protein
MQELFLKALRWYIIVVFSIGGLAALHIADVQDSIKPVMPAIFCLGLAFVLSMAWKEIRRKVLFFTLVLCVALAYIAQFLPDIIYVLSGREMIMNYFVAWVALVTIVGFPVIMYVYHRFGD